MSTPPLIIRDFDKAVADSPHKGHALMRNVNIDEFPGAMKASKITESVFQTAISKEFTADAGTDIITMSATVPLTGTAVTLTTTNTLPAGLSTSTIYFIIKESSTTAKLATTRANAEGDTQIDITDAGTGTHTITSVNPGTIEDIAFDSRNSNRFMQDSNGRVWVEESGGTAWLITGNTLTSSDGNGIVLFRTSDGTATYLFAFRNAAVDVVDVFGDSDIQTPSWTNGWQTLNSGAGSRNSHKAIVGQDNIIYFCDGRFVGSIREKDGQVFDPASGATYTYNNQALDLVQGEVSFWLEELGVNLLVSGLSYNKIYPWDRVSDSFSLPINVPERIISRMKNIGEIVYIQAGRQGNIYMTQGSFVRHFKKLPEYVINNTNSITSNPITWGGIGSNQDALVVGIGATSNSAASGVYLIYPDGRITQDNTPSTGATRPVSILADSNDFYRLGYASGADRVDTSRYANYECVYQSEFFEIATNTERGTYSELELVLAKPSNSGNIRVSYRKDTSSAFITLDTFVSDSSMVVFNNDGIGLIDLENIQLQLEYHGNVEIKELRLLP